MLIAAWAILPSKEKCEERGFFLKKVWWDGSGCPRLRSEIARLYTDPPTLLRPFHPRTICANYEYIRRAKRNLALYIISWRSDKLEVKYNLQYRLITMRAKLACHNCISSCLRDHAVRARYSDLIDPTAVADTDSNGSNSREVRLSRKERVRWHLKLVHAQVNRRAVLLLGITKGRSRQQDDRRKRSCHGLFEAPFIVFPQCFQRSRLFKSIAC